MPPTGDELADEEGGSEEERDDPTEVGPTEEADLEEDLSEREPIEEEDPKEDLKEDPSEGELMEEGILRRTPRKILR